jgi:hypothetical protein
LDAMLSMLSCLSESVDRISSYNSSFDFTIWFISNVLVITCISYSSINGRVNRVFQKLITIIDICIRSMLSQVKT